MRPTAAPLPLSSGGSRSTVNKEEKPVLRDRDLREPLFLYLEERFGKIRILEEKVTGKSRADVLMVTEDAVYGIEIKSDADTYARLSRQVPDYDRYYDFNYVVCGTSHGLHIEEHVPPYWGIITAELSEDGQADFYELRKPVRNVKRDLLKKLSLLWRPELFEIQMKHGMPKYRDRSKEEVIQRIAALVPAKVPEQELDREISGLLLERDYTKAEETLREFRRSETAKKLDSVTDPEERMALILFAEERKARLQKNRKKRKRRRRTSI